MRQSHWTAVALRLAPLDEKSCRQHMSSMGFAFEMALAWLELPFEIEELVDPRGAPKLHA